MSNNSKISDLFDQYVMSTYSRTVNIVRGEGSKVWSDTGMVYLDFTAGIAVQNVGHSHPTVVEAIKKQAETLTHCSNLYFAEKQALLAKRLSDMSLGGKCFFCNSGAEANEAMIKLARLWGHEEGRYEVVTMLKSFHGRTLATCAATGQSKVQEGYDPLPLGFAYAMFNDIDSVKEAINERTVAIMLECVQGEGGVLPIDPEFIKEVRALCDEKNLLLLCDEIQCGMGRTGNWFGFQGTDVKPDAFTVAKAIASGVPMGALVASPKLSDVFKPGSHGSTFGGNPLACAAALATLDVIEKENLLERATEAGNLIIEGLEQFAEKYDQIIEVRGKGLMIGIELDRPAADLVEKCREVGLLACLAGPNVMRLIPPLNVKDDEIEEAIDIIDDALDLLFGEDAEQEEADGEE